MSWVASTRVPQRRVVRSIAAMWTRGYGFYPFCSNSIFDVSAAAYISSCMHLLSWFVELAPEFPWMLAAPTSTLSVYSAACMGKLGLLLQLLMLSHIWFYDGHLYLNMELRNCLMRVIVDTRLFNSYSTYWYLCVWLMEYCAWNTNTFKVTRLALDHVIDPVRTECISHCSLQRNCVFLPSDT